MSIVAQLAHVVVEQFANFRQLSLGRFAVGSERLANRADFAFERFAIVRERPANCVDVGRGGHRGSDPEGRADDSRRERRERDPLLHSCHGRWSP